MESTSNILQTTIRILKEGAICNHCLGRLFAKLSTGLSNDARGEAIKLVLSMEADIMRQESASTELLEQLAPSSEHARRILGVSGDDEPCWVCNGLFENIETWANRALEALSKIEYNSFLVGTKITGLLSENEEILWAESGTHYAEPLKTELNREVGKIIEQRTGKQADIKKPDVMVLLELEKETVSLKINPLYIRGRYRKLIRGIPQTRWPCRECKGSGCEECGFSGKQYPESVDELISEVVITAFEAEDTVFHGAGREDIDALMLGDGRPFILEVKHAKKRSVNLKTLQEQINRHASGKVEVLELTSASSEEIEQIKQARADKVYRLKAILEESVPEEKLKSSLHTLKGTITQHTPTRVLHRRSDLPRKRRVYSVELEHFNGNTAVLTIHCEGGLYVKELISGDEGRTKPNLSEALGVAVKVVELDVIKVKL
jgi:tRNA pseudouridine synthase 10